jgi:NADPH:quinone reductase-like Zn-dependent oxidoreductase
VGRIFAVGEEVASSRIGERVMVDFSIYNTETDSLAEIDYFGHGRDGGYAEYMVLPAENAHRVVTPISDAELATFCCAYLTGEHMLDRARVAAGDRVLITGASGGVGSGLIQLCRARGAIPCAVVGRGKEQAVAAIGAEAVITRGSGDLVSEVNAATGGKPIDVVADLVAGPLFNDLLRVLRLEGRYATVGAISGPLVQLDLLTLYLKHLEMHGSSQGTRGAFRRLVRYIEEGKIKGAAGGGLPALGLSPRSDRFHGEALCRANSSSFPTRNGRWRGDRAAGDAVGHSVRKGEMFHSDQSRRAGSNLFDHQ